MQVIGLAAALDYMEGIGRSRIRAHEEALSAYAHDRLSSINSANYRNSARERSDFVFHDAGSACARRRELPDRHAPAKKSAGAVVRDGVHIRWRALYRRPMKPHALETVRSAIAIQADIRCRSARCGADASMIPGPVLQGVECGLAFAVHSRRHASFRRR